MLDGLYVEGWLVLFWLQSWIGLCKFELMRELAEVNCWLPCILKCWLARSCVTIANLLISEVISWKSESVRRFAWSQPLSGLFFEMLGGLPCSHKLEVEVSQAIGWSQLLDGLSFEVWVFDVFVTIAFWSLFKIRSWKSELARELTEVNWWVFCMLKWWPVLFYVTIARWPISEVTSWKPESVWGVGWSQLLVALSFEVLVGDVLCQHGELACIWSYKLKDWSQLEELSEVNCCLGCFLKCGEGLSEAISWKSKLVRQFAEDNWWLVNPKMEVGVREGVGWSQLLVGLCFEVLVCVDMLLPSWVGSLPKS